jgi:hypothetical protein
MLQVVTQQNEGVRIEGRLATWYSQSSKGVDLAVILNGEKEEAKTGTDILDRVIGSQAFASSPSLRTLLIYLWEHRDNSISEYAIATEALGRQSSFDAKIDATVRVQISRLRQRLDKFYLEEGRCCPDRLSIPLGTHQLKLAKVIQNVAAEPPVPDRVFVAKTTKKNFGRPYLLTLVACLAVACVVEGVWLHRARQPQPSESAPLLNWFWKSFLSNGLPTRVILPTPTFLSFRAPGHAGHTFMFRDTEVNDFETATALPVFRQLSRNFGTPSLAENYTVTSDTFASIHLVRYLDSFGIHSVVASSVDAPLEALNRENEIAIGTWGTLASLQVYLDRITLKLVEHELVVRDVRPGSTINQEYRSLTESPDRAIWPGVIAVLPGESNRGRLLIVASRTTEGLVSFLTTTESLDELEKLWTKQGRPKYFEMVVNSEVAGRGIVRTWPVTLRRYAGLSK